ncbi:MAG: twin-arginine translocase subunit TatC [Phycisphaerales bacterium]|nr:twin-arginine translocase subunit TatC [Phycisphaerales bacterium]
MFNKVVNRRNAEAVMGLGEHLDELRKRVMLAVVGLLPIFIVAVVYGQTLLTFILRPAVSALREAGLPPDMQITGFMEGFSAYFYIAFVVTVAIGAPWVLYQLWKFIAPGLYASERKFVHILAPLSSVLAISGMALMYYVMLPIALGFLTGFALDLGKEDIRTVKVPAGTVFPTIPIFAGDPESAPPGAMWINTEIKELRFAISTGAPSLPASTPAPTPANTESTKADASTPATTTATTTEPAAPSTSVIYRGVPLRSHSLVTVAPKIDQYLSLFINLALLFAICFQLPAVILLLGWLGLVTTTFLGKYRKFAFAGAVIVAAVASPTGDPLSLAILQIPLYLLYELGILLLWLLPASRINADRQRELDRKEAERREKDELDSLGGDDNPNPPDATGP